MPTNRMKTQLLLVALCSAYFVVVSAFGGDTRFTNPPTITNPTNSVRTNQAFVTMDTLEDKHKLVLGDKLSFRIMEDQEDPTEKMESKPMVVTDHGDVEVPYIGLFPAAGKTCRELAQEIKKEL